MHQFVSVNKSSIYRPYDNNDDYRADEYRCLRYNLDDFAYGTDNRTDSIDLCPQDACLPERPMTNPSWRTCKRKCNASSIICYCISLVSTCN